MVLSETLLIAIGFCCLLSLIAYLAGYRALMIVGSLAWVVIAFESYQETQSLLILANLILVAAGQCFLPSREDGTARFRRR